MTNRTNLFALVAFILVALLAPPAVYAANPEAKQLFDRGAFEYQDGKYEDALSYLDKAIKIEPGNLEYQTLKGIVLSRLKRYNEAIAVLSQVVAADPSGQKEAVVELANAYAASKDNQNAVKYYTAAIAANPQRSDLLMSRGLAYLNLKQYPQARADFSEVARLDPRLKPFAYYHLALVSYLQEDYTAAKAKLNEALTLNPDPGLRKNCQDFLANIGKEEKAHKFFSGTAALVVSYDDNIISDPLNEALSAGTDKSDMSYGLNFTATIKPISTRTQELGLFYSFLSNFYVDLDEYNSLTHSLGVYYLVNKAPLTFKIRGDYSYHYVDSEDKMSLGGISPSVVWAINPNNRLEVAFGMQYRRAYDDTIDANHYTLRETFYHDVRLKDNKVLGLRAGLNSELDNPLMDTGFKYEKHELQAGMTLPALAGFITDLSASYGQVNYAQHDYYGSDRRSDNQFSLSLKVSRFIMDRAQIMFMWSYFCNDSNVSQDGDDDLDPYEYKRNLYALYVTLFF